MLNGAGESQFNLTRSDTGQYDLSVFAGDGVTKKSEDDGMLILSVADTLGESTTIGSAAILSYEFDAASGDFKIEARELIDLLSTTPNGGFENEFELTDTDFYFTWVDFTTPLMLLTADFNKDGSVDGDDFLLWQANFGTTEGATSSRWRRRWRR